MTGRAIPFAACVATLVLVAVLGTPLASQVPSSTFQPALTAPESLAPFLTHLEAGSDAFPLEGDAEAIEDRLRDLGVALQRGGAWPDALFAPEFSARLPAGGADDVSTGGAGLAIVRAADAPSIVANAEATGKYLRTLAGSLGTLVTTEFHVTAIERLTDTDRRVEVRAELVGQRRDGARASHVAAWRMTWRHANARWALVEWTTGDRQTSRAAAPLFVDVTSAALHDLGAAQRQFGLGLDAWNARLDAVITRDSNGHHGIAVGDADGDGLEDLYIAQPSGLPNRLLRARGDGTFEDITERAGVGLLDDTAQPLFADVDNDGDQDLVLAMSVQPLLLRNDGQGRFTVVPEAFRFDAPLEGLLTGIATADVDRDGFLDVYLCVYSYFFGAGEDKAGTPMPYHDARNGPPGVLLRNDGRGRFVDATREMGLADGNDRYHFAATFGDLDEDGWPDLLVANDFGTKNLYRNLGRQADGRVRFEDVAAKAGVLDHGAGMSAAMLDYDNDGRLDLYTGNMWAPSGLRVTHAPTFMPDAPADVRALYRRHARGNSLFRNRGDFTFEDRSVEAGVTVGRWAWASDAIDIDSDGWQDLYIVNGMLSREGAETDLEGFFWRQVVARSPLTRLKGQPYDEAWRAMNLQLVRGSIARRQRNVLLRNDRGRRFDDVSGAAGLDLDHDGRGFAVLDLDRDGDPDLAIMAARQAPHLRLFRNDHPRRPVVALRLTGTASNRDAIGARVIVETDTFTTARQVTAGSGFLSQHSREVLVGLGESRAVRRLTVVWPSGTRQVFDAISPDTRYRLTEGGTLEGSPIVRDVEPMTAPRAASPPTAPPTRTWFFERFPTPSFSATLLDGSTITSDALRGRPLLVGFWRSDVAQARTFLSGLAAARPALDTASVGLVAIALDAPDAATRVQADVPSGLPAIHATRDLGLLWAIVHRHLYMNRQPLPLPSALLIDGEGRVAAAYRGAIDVGTVVEDARALDVADRERLARALPFGGAFHTPLTPRNLLPFGRELLDEGLEQQAIVALERAAQTTPSAPLLYRLGSILMKAGHGARARASFEQAIALDPSMAEAHNDLGTIVAEGGDLAQAIAQFRRALAAAPDYPDALNNLGYALLLSGQDAEARPLYERALALQPDFPEALNNLGLLAGRAGDLDTAERRFREALARRPEYGEAANNLALVLVNRGRADQAVALLEQAITSMPTFEEAYVTLAKIHLSAGRTAEGLRAVERLLQRNPTHPIGLALAAEFRPK